MKKMLLFMLAAVFCAQCCLAAPDNSAEYKQNFENILNRLGAIAHLGERPSPEQENGAEEIINNSKWLAYAENTEELDKLNQPLKSMGVEGVTIIPAAMVDKAVCEYYGFTVANYEALEEAAQTLALNGDYYHVGPGDPGIVNFKVENVTILKNGLALATGVEDSDDKMAFRALFKKSSCGGKAHWVLLNLIYTTMLEELDDYKIPVDK